LRSLEANVAVAPTIPFIGVAHVELSARFGAVGLR